MSKTLIEHLKDLKKNVTGGNTSVLVGAGFSKNVSEDFLSWSELLKDLVIELYQHQIRKDFALLQGTGQHEGYEKFLNSEVRSYISDKGFLQLASDYIRKKGYAEAIGVYIEQRIPLALKKGSKRILRKNVAGIKVEEEIPDEKFFLHSRLIELPWQNIFTTNYDNLLEICIDSEIEEKIKQKIETVLKEISDAQGNLNTSSDELAQLQNEQGLNEHMMNQHLVSGSADAQRGDTAKKKTALDILSSSQSQMPTRIKIEELIRKIKGLEYFIQESTDLYNKFTLLKDECYSIVSHSSQLALKKAKNIIKLHGDLRHSDDSKFGFDNDLRSHYIIAQEDYDNYPAKHEAFTQLMRISLLQQCFCLIGFSGDDPNFLAWVSWVRDIIEKKSHKDSDSVVKVYMISVSSEPLTLEKKIFFQNHRILYISLLDNEVIKFLELQTGKNVRNGDRSEVLRLFVDYLSDEANVNRVKIAMELIEQKEYQSFWNKLPILDIRKPDLKEVLQLDCPRHLRKTNRIPSIINSRREAFLNWAGVILPQIKSEEKSKFIHLIIYAIGDYFVPPSIVGSGDSSLLEAIRFEDVDSSDIPEFLLILLKDSLWQNDHERFDKALHDIESEAEIKNKIDFNNLHYQRCLFAAFNFDFEGLKVLLREWNPTEMWQTRKAGLMALFDQLEAAQFLKKGGSLSVLQEQLYKVLLQRFLQQIIDYRGIEKFNEVIQRLKKEGLKDFDDNVQYIFDTDFPKQPIQPYGSGKFSLGSMEFVTSSPVIRSVQFFGILAESGFPLAIKNVSLCDQKKVYSLLKQSFEYLPFPLLFYALQFPNESLLRRLGQDYAYSEKVSNLLPEISNKLQSAYAGDVTPLFIKKNILHFYAELLIALNPVEWNEFFLKVWDDKIERAFDKRYFHSNHILFNGLKYVSDKKIIIKIVEDCLRVVVSHDVTDASDQAVTYLFYLSGNPALEPARGIGQEVNINSLIDRTIDRISPSQYSSVFALGNVHTLLSESQKKTIKEKLRDCNLSEVENDRIWSVILFFADADELLVDTIGEAIVENPVLWRSNITPKSASSKIEFIPIHRLRKSPDFPTGIKWTESQIDRIYLKMQVELRRIVEFLKKRKEIYQYHQILLEMVNFLKDEAQVLAGNQDYQETLQIAQNYYSEQCSFTTIQEGLESNVKSEVILALTELSIQIYYKRNIDSHISLIELILNKVLFQSEPGLDVCLSYASQWLYDFLDHNKLQVLGSKILSILKRYQKSLPEEAELPFVQERLSKLASVLHEWKIVDPLVSHYMIITAQSRFNYV
jgi:hypothetical protein